MDRRGLLVTLVVLSFGRTASAASPAAKGMNELATAKGCYLCHRVEPGPADPQAMLPFAPSWKDIALRYKGQKGAADRLARTIRHGSGSDPKTQHWYGKVSQVGMLPNAAGIDEDQAKRLARWILSFAPLTPPLE